MHADAGATISLSSIAAAIGEPARARMLCHLLDGRARTSTELAIIGEISPSTASVHLQRLLEQRLLKVFPQGKHRYYSLGDKKVATALESLTVLATATKFVPTTPSNLRVARTCYDHIAGALGVFLYDHMISLKWLSTGSNGGNGVCHLTPNGSKYLTTLGIDVADARMQRRRFAYPCLDWSERRPHLAGSLGAALLKLALGRKWVERELDSRALRITGRGRREMQGALALRAEQLASLVTP